MARLSISDLPLPAPKFDAELAPLDARGRKRFETTHDAVAEDRKRTRLAQRQGRKHSDLVARLAVRRLAKQLARKRVPCTPASARHMHDMRRRIVGALWQLVRDED